MNSKRKRLMKLMQSIGIQRNDFVKTLNSIRNYDRWNRQEIIDWINFKKEINKSDNQLPIYITSDAHWNGYLINLALTFNEVGINVLNENKDFKGYELLDELALKWDELD